MKLSDKFDSNPILQNSGKTHFCQKRFLKFDLDPKDQGQSLRIPRNKVTANNRIREQNIPPLNKQSKDLLGNCSVTDDTNRL